MADTEAASGTETSRQLASLVAAGFEDQLLLPGTETYKQRVDSWWSVSARLNPIGIVQPRTTEDVSRLVATLKDLKDVKFAVRSGGHSQWAGGSSIEDGITIDLGHLNTTTYNTGKGTASIGPGDVLWTLEEKGVAVVGGRDANVGVAGFVTGGGISYYTGRHGFGCDNIVNAEIVLADGSIINANANENPDLWRALKGGSGNFGIVTRFDLKTFPGRLIWGGMRTSPKTEAKALIEYLVKFTDEYHKHPEAAFVLNFTYNPAALPDIIIAHVMVDIDGVEDAPVFRELRKTPELSNDIKKRPTSGIAKDFSLPSGLHNIWQTLTFKNDARVVQKAAELHEELVANLLQVVPVKELGTQSLFQPLPKFIADIGVAAGGNALGLNTVDENCLLWLCAVSVHSVEYEPVVAEMVASLAAVLDNYAKSINSGLSWVYLNYADSSQDPTRTYGEETVKFLWKVSRKYDPEGVFQNQRRAGFKLPPIFIRAEAGSSKL